MALAEISFPKSWFTISKEGGRITITCELNPTHIDSVPNEKQTLPKVLDIELFIPRGYYKSVRDVVEEINNIIAKTLSNAHTFLYTNEQRTYTPLDETKWPKFKCSETNRKVSVMLPPNTRIKLDNSLASLLGWGINPLVNMTDRMQTLSGTNASDINGGINNMYIYTDIIENMIVGDMQAPLLRIVPAGGKFGDVVHQSFETLRYIPLRKKSFDTIELDIRDVFGEPVSFESGILVVTLHFRRASIQRFL